MYFRSVLALTMIVCFSVSPISNLAFVVTSHLSLILFFTSRQIIAFISILLRNSVRYYTAEKIIYQMAKFQPLRLRCPFTLFEQLCVYSGALLDKEVLYFFLISFYSICGYQVVL